MFNREKYKKELRNLQIQLVKLQRHIIEHGHKILVILEGRDASGKDGVIKRITEHLSPRETRVVALGKPSERETNAWYFQRYVEQLPLTSEMVLFNRSWYNRAGVERVMGFCTDVEYESFMNTVNDFEALLINSGINLLKYYLDISKKEQEERLQERKESPLTQWKSSPIDNTAIQHWDEYSNARNEMLMSTHSPDSPWIIVKANDKRKTRVNVIKDLLSRVECPRSEEHTHATESDLIFPYKKECLTKGLLYR